MTLSLSRSALFTSLLTMSLLTGCHTLSPVNADSPTTTKAKSNSPAVETVIGNYVSEGYSKRAQGKDWVAVLITANGNTDGAEQINIKVRARSDVKKPTCTFDGQATLMGQDKAHGVIFQSVANGSKVFLQFKDTKLIIDSEDKYALNYYCSGGGSIVGEYQKLAGQVELN